MKNRWNTTSTTEETTTPKKSSSKKIGIAMGVVGALLVAAGAAPMIFQGGENLQGNITAQQSEAPDPLVALLSGGNIAKPSAAPANETLAPTATNTAQTTKPVATVPAVASLPAANAVATKAPTPTAAISTKAPVATKAMTEIDKILTEEGQETVQNANTGEKDIAGSAFGEVETMHGAAGLSNTASTKNAASTKKEQPKPKTTVQTGVNTSLLLGALFLIFGLAIQLPSFLRRKV